MAWALWLAAPVVMSAAAGVLLWLRGLPRRPVTTPGSIAGHRRYLDALASTARTDLADLHAGAVTVLEPAAGTDARDGLSSPG